MMPSAIALAAYSADLAAGPWEFLPDAGGFSGARIWRSPNWRLKAWPRGTVAAEQLRETHRWMRHAAGLEFVPRVLPTKTGDTLVDDGACLWDIVTWMPGEPMLREPTPARLIAAGRCLARLHHVWQRCTPRIGICPAVQRRLLVLNDRASGDALLTAHGELAKRLIVECRNELLPWTTNVEMLHPCLCDVWSDHVLFVGDDVSGLIDFGEAKIDHPAVDLARLLGDCLGGERWRWVPFLDAYQLIRILSPRDHLLIDVLDRAGTVVALLTWLQRSRQRNLTPRERDRFAKIVARCEQIARRS